MYSSLSYFEGDYGVGYLQSVYQANLIYSSGKVTVPAVSIRFGVSIISNSSDTALCLTFSHKK